jgi:hypothetical protein
MVDGGWWVKDEIGPPAPSYHDRTASLQMVEGRRSAVRCNSA